MPTHYVTPDEFLSTVRKRVGKHPTMRNPVGRFGTCVYRAEVRDSHNVPTGHVGCIIGTVLVEDYGYTYSPAWETRDASTIMADLPFTLATGRVADALQEAFDRQVKGTPITWAEALEDYDDEYPR